MRMRKDKYDYCLECGEKKKDCVKAKESEK
jgi:hypothetical protein